MNPIDSPNEDQAKFNLSIQHQDSYSRSDLLLRTLFGPIYIVLPHILVLIFIMIGSGFLNFVAFFAVLFTGRHPQGMFDYQVKAMRWEIRLNASLLNLVDGYPAFGLNTKTDNVVLEVPYPEKLSIGLHILKWLFGFIYVLIPHAFCLIFRQIASSFLGFLAFWVILFTGKFPDAWHAFNVGTIRWGIRIRLYMMWMTDEYPPFSGK